MCCNYQVGIFVKLLSIFVFEFRNDRSLFFSCFMRKLINRESSSL